MTNVSFEVGERALNQIFEQSVQQVLISAAIPAKPFQDHLSDQTRDLIGKMHDFHQAEVTSAAASATMAEIDKAESDPSIEVVYRVDVRVVAVCAHKDSPHKFLVNMPEIDRELSSKFSEQGYLLAKDAAADLQAISDDLRGEIGGLLAAPSMEEPRPPAVDVNRRVQPPANFAAPGHHQI